MSRWSRAGKRADAYWKTVWGDGMSAATCTTVTMFFVGIVFIIDAMLLIPFSIYHAIRENRNGKSES